MGYTDCKYIGPHNVPDVVVESTITLTQAQVVALFLRDQRLRQPNGRLVTSLVEKDAKAYCEMLGAPEEWSASLVEGVVGK